MTDSGLPPRAFAEELAAMLEAYLTAAEALRSMHRISNMMRWPHWPFQLTVALGAALFTVVSRDGFGAGDPGRIAAQLGAAPLAYIAAAHRTLQPPARRRDR